MTKRKGGHVTLTEILDRMISWCTAGDVTPARCYNRG